MVDLIGQQFGNYRLTSLLGSGGFAEVYLGVHVRLGMQAAIKVLRAHLAGEDGTAFQEEARTIAELIHPNIIRVLDFDLQNGTPFLVLDYAPSGSLRQRHKRGERVPLEQIILYVNQIASALQYAHDRKHIHRDVKPENMLIGRQNEILLTDFGIASVAHSTSSMNTEAPMGTLAYMSPEQLQGHARPASDQYALGVVVYQWLVGVLPFRGSSAEIIGQQLGGTPPPLRSISAEISPGVEQVVMKALAKDPRARFISVQAFAAALVQASQGVDAQTFSYTATTVASSEPGQYPAALHPPGQEVAFAPVRQPSETFTDPLVETRSGSSPFSTQYQAARSPAQYPVPNTPYRSANLQKPVEEKQPFIAGIVLLNGFLLGVCLAIPSFLHSIVLTLPFRLGLDAVLCFLWGLGVAVKTGLLRASFLVSLCAVFGFALVSVLFTSAVLGALLLVFLIDIGLSVLGGLIGRGIHRSRQPIHPPAGGSLF